MHSTHEGIAADLASLRDTGKEVLVWGQIEVNVPDAFGTHINAERLEVLEESAAEADWVPYANDAFGYALMFPPDTTLLEGADGRSIQISGPLVDNERWPMIEVQWYY